MESCSCLESAAVDDPARTAIVGLGNPLYGDDGVGVIVAQSVFEIVHRRADIDLIDCPAPGARLAERLIGYQQAVLIDTLVNAQAKVGTVICVDILEHSSDPPVSLHITGFHDVLALARMVGMAVPNTIRIYGIVIREPRRFSVCLSPELAAAVAKIARAIAAAELRNAESL